MNSLIMLIIVIPLAIIFLALIIGLQIFLSKRESKWLGLVIPIINLIFAFMASFGMMAYSEDYPGALSGIITSFLVLAIPAVVNFLIYLACREKVKKDNNNELEKMNIQDLD